MSFKLKLDLCSRSILQGLTGEPGFPDASPSNKVTNAEDLANASWTKTAASVTSNEIVAPNGTMTADLITPTAAGGAHLVASNSFALDGVANTVSLYVKANGYKFIGIREGLVTGVYASFNAETGEFIESSNGAYTVSNPTTQDIGDGWHLISFELTGSSVANLGLFVLPNTYTTGNPNDISWTPDGTSGIYVWRVQAYV